MSPSKTEMDPAKRDLLLQKSKYFLTATHEDFLAYMTGDASTIEELDRKYQEKERKRKKKELQRQMENLPLMRTTIIEKTGRALLNCEALNTDEAKMKTPLEALFGAKARSNSLDIKNIIKVMGYIGASNETFKNLFEKYKKPLALKYEQLIFKDDYGDFDESLVLKEYKSFLSKKTDGLFFAKRCDIHYKDDGRKNIWTLNFGYEPEGKFLFHNCSQTISKTQGRIARIFSPKELSPCLDELSKKLLSEVKKYRASAQYKKAHKADVSFEDLSPYDYEKQVAQSLSEMGWKTQVTKASGDQGCDVLAVKGGARVAIQCKYYSKPIGNKAVQEINAAKSYYDANFAAVVSNQSYTPAAKLLATKLQVALLHHSQLNGLLKECQALKRGSQS